jgi:hypothetical protein
MQPAVTLFPPSLSDPFPISSKNTPLLCTETVLEQLIHDLRQPLSAIENHAYVLELSAVDPRVCCHLQAIQDLVAQAHSILEKVAGAANTLSSR